MESARECDFVFLAVSGTFALQYAKKISEKGGPYVIDNSSAFRYVYGEGDKIETKKPRSNSHFPTKKD